MKRRFNDDFWVDERGWLAMGLDAEKRQIDALVSNAGHCLWTGILDDAHAEVVAGHLLSDDLFTGWGIRTLAASMAGYNPISYHNGSVWPHDTAITVAGLMRYGYVDEALRVVEGLLAAGGFFAGRLPELFAGLSREEQPFTVSYPTSCSPQAWAAAAPLLVLRAILRLEPDAGEGVLHIAPALPAWLRNLRIDGIRVRDGLVSVEVSDHDQVTVTATPADFVVVHEPRPGNTPD
ncbi:MAG: hypothetical protein E6G60_08705 [Actinobacteria bacterium]|nr:MAG: hypothetical protein E6G60_08705 [Actinomycetota bacterium]